MLRGNVAYNPTTPAETLAALCGDPDLGVRSKAADNPSCPPGVLAWIAADKRSSWQQRSSVAANPSCPPQVREQLANDRNEAVRSAAAASRACAPDLLAQLITDRRRMVRLAAASNPNCPIDALEDAYRSVISSTRHWDEQIKRAAFDNRTTRLG